MTDIVDRIASRIHDSHMQIEQLLDEAAEEIRKLRGGAHIQGVLCEEDADWDWWLKQSPEFRGRIAKAARVLSDADKMKSHPQEYPFKEIGHRISAEAVEYYEK